MIVEGAVAIPDTKRGLYRKFDVSRTDGSSNPGGRHHGCKYFVLDLTHDRYAKVALLAYADACRADFPKLADDLAALAHGDRTPLRQLKGRRGNRKS